MEEKTTLKLPTELEIEITLETVDLGDIEATRILVSSDTISAIVVVRGRKTLAYICFTLGYFWAEVKIRQFDEDTADKLQQYFLETL